MVLGVIQSPPPHIVTSKPPNHYNLLLQHLNECKDMSQLKQIHALSLRSTFPNQPTTLFLYSRILHFSSLHDLNYAYRVFDQIDNRNSFMWNILIRACAQSQSAHRKQAHAHLLKLGFQSDIYINNSLIHFYASCGSLESAKNVFDKMPQRSLVSWNAMIDAFVLFGEFETALQFFVQFQQQFFEPDGLDSMGYKPDYSQAPMVDDLNTSKRDTLRLHSERLAIALGLLNLKPGMPIRIFKNLRVCDDCHKVTGLISEIFNVEIIVRDRVRFHHFKDGSCSCMDYW
ncbi:hypothetical protein OIU84_000646 [Salix udensis]|uniref:DYW domain-containing protein n=1 Tax=Salix udensis TaxID=889485 RepID=A0AAD6L6E1_9ROSI|nr:hypothetical protein OIU84_000646 [Salix udensis]